MTGGSPRAVLAAAALAAALAAGCAPNPDRPLLDRFFAASRLRDRTALQALASTIFDPAAQGIVTTYTVIRTRVRREGGVEVKDVTLAAPVRKWSGETVREMLIVTLRRRDGRWIVAGVREVRGEGAASIPRS